MKIDDLPHPGLVKKQSAWDLRGWTNDDRSRVVDGSLQVTCVPRRHGMQSGSGFFSQSQRMFPCDEATVSYEVFFPDSFTWVKGGKVGFGFGLGDGDEYASGADWENRCGSVRTMWREGGQAIGYLYLPKEGLSRDGVIRAQSKAFQASCEGSLGKPAGIDVFFKNRAGLSFTKGWNSVSVHVKLNAPGKNDGVYRLTVNGVTRELTDVKYRNNGSIHINGVIFSTFFGGSSGEWACTTPQRISFRRVQVVTPS